MKRARSQSGASLVVVLAFVVFVSAIVPAVLGMSITGLRISGSSTEQRNELYAAASAVEVAIAAGTSDPTVGAFEKECSDTHVALDDLDVLVSCQGYPKQAEGCGKGARVVGYLAQVSRPGTSEVLTQLSAEVVYQPDPDGAQSAVVSQWDTNSRELPKFGVTACNFEVTTTTSTTIAPTSTTSTVVTTSTVAPTTTTMALPTTTTGTTTTTAKPTTTTTAPVRQVTAQWSDSSVIRKGGKWNASGTVTVLDDARHAVAGVGVAVAVEYLDANGLWQSATSVSGTTDRDGTVGFTSDRYPRKGKKAASEVRFTIKEVRDGSGRTWNSDAFPAALTLLSP